MYVLKSRQLLSICCCQRVKGRLGAFVAKIWRRLSPPPPAGPSVLAGNGALARWPHQLLQQQDRCAAAMRGVLSFFLPGQRTYLMLTLLARGALACTALSAHSVGFRQDKLVPPKHRHRFLFHLGFAHNNCPCAQASTRCATTAATCRSSRCATRRCCGRSCRSTRRGPPRVSARCPRRAWKAAGSAHTPDARALACICSHASSLGEGARCSYSGERISCHVRDYHYQCRHDMAAHTPNVQCGTAS